MNLTVRKTELTVWPYCVETDIHWVDKTLLSRINDWLDGNGIKHASGIFETRMWYFRSERDATLFLLKWS